MGDINRGGVNRVSSVNSTTSTLTANSTFTGSWEDVLEFSHITIQVIVSHVSATDGLQIQWSSDSSNIDGIDTFTIPANTGKVFTFGPQARYMRIVYTNNSTNQTSFRLHTVLKLHLQKPSTHRINDDLSPEDDAEIVKAVLTAEDNAGIFKNLRSDSAGRLLISSDVTTPIDTTEVVVSDIGNVSGTPVDTYYTITNGKTLTLQLFQAGAEANSIGGSKVSLYYDPNANLTGMTLLTVIYVNGSSFENSISTSLVGNGTRRLVLRRETFAGSGREIFGRAKGFEQ